MTHVIRQGRGGTKNIRADSSIVNVNACNLISRRLSLAEQIVLTLALW